MMNLGPFISNAYWLRLNGRHDTMQSPSRYSRSKNTAVTDTQPAYVDQNSLPVISGHLVAVNDILYTNSPAICSAYVRIT